jgi:RAB protein geranylgeranyltransferase component A
VLITSNLSVFSVLFQKRIVSTKFDIYIVIVSSDSAHDEVYAIQHYVIKFLSDMRQVGGFLRVLHQ